MRKPIQFLFTCCWVFCSIQPIWAQQTSANVMTILRASLAAQVGQKVIQDVTLSGNAGTFSGSDDETVPFSFKATLSGSARTDISLSSGTLTEIRTMASSGPTGNWSKGSGETHALVGHNLMTDPAWCSPVLILERIISNPATVVSFVGTEDGLAHFSAYQPIPSTTPTGSQSLVQHLSQMELYLDPKTLLPSKLSFNTHPDNNALTDLPVLVEFSNYQAVDGITLPMHVQRYLNGSLALDIQVENVTVNSGLSSTSF
jgi:hypothetical protein